MYYKQDIRRVLNKTAKGALSANDAYNALRDLPYKDLGFAKIDHHRAMRKGFPEVIYCQGKTEDQVERIVASIYKKGKALLLTRATEKLFGRLKAGYPGLSFNRSAGIIFSRHGKKTSKKTVLIVTGGTADMPVAEEAKVTLDVMGNKVDTLYDAGVAGLHRLLDHKDKLAKANVIIVIAGMEGALASVVGGLVARPVIAVPTSVGYGASFEGLAPLLTMLNSCSPGIGVVNIDNGFGAGYLASLINS